jgi:hypothetical protein
METLHCPSRMSDEAADTFCGTRLTPASYDILFRRSVRLLKEDGTLLAVYLREAIPDELANAAYPTFHKMDGPPKNRGIAAVGRAHQQKVLANGKLSNTSMLTDLELEQAGLKGSVSGIMGYMDRYARMPYCRKTAFNMDHPELFAAAMPYIQHVSELFKQHAPDRYAAQQAMCAKTSPDFIIPGTVYTTITVNRNFPTRVHKDAGDLKEGFGNMSVFRRGHYRGAHFVFPKYRVAFDMGNRDLLLGDVHEWHGNTDMVGDKSRFERISCVFYYRERMKVCGTATEEFERAKNRKAGDPL